MWLENWNVLTHWEGDKGQRLNRLPEVNDLITHACVMKSSQSVQFSCSVVSDSLRPHGLYHTRPPCPSPTPGVYPNSCPLSQWCHPTVSFSVIPFSSCLQSFPTSGSFQMSQLFASGGQNIGVSASTSVLPMNTQDWVPLGWTGILFLCYFNAYFPFIVIIKYWLNSPCCTSLNISYIK